MRLCKMTITTRCSLGVTEYNSIEINDGMLSMLDFRPSLYIKLYTIAIKLNQSFTLMNLVILFQSKINEDAY